MKVYKNIPRWNGGRIIIFSAVIIAVFTLFTTYAGGEETTLRGVPLEDHELDDIHGGFLSNGDFIYFSMDFMQMKFLLNGNENLAALGSDRFVNSLRQRASITEDGIEMELEVLQSGSLGGNNPAAPGQLPMSSLTQVTFRDNHGFVNANIINGNNNTAAITNVFNIRIGVFQVKDVSDIKPMLNSIILP